MITLTNKKQTLFSAAMIAGALTLTACADNKFSSESYDNNPSIANNEPQAAPPALGEPAYPIQPIQTNEPTQEYAIATINAEPAYLEGYTGAGVNIFTFSTAETNHYLEGRTSYQIDVVADSEQAEITDIENIYDRSLINGQNCAVTCRIQGTAVNKVLGAQKNDTDTHGIAYGADIRNLASATFMLGNNPIASGYYGYDTLEGEQVSPAESYYIQNLFQNSDFIRDTNAGSPFDNGNLADVINININFRKGIHCPVTEGCTIVRDIDGASTTLRYWVPKQERLSLHSMDTLTDLVTQGTIFVAGTGDFGYNTETGVMHAYTNQKIKYGDNTNIDWDTEVYFDNERSIFLEEYALSDIASTQNLTSQISRLAVEDNRLLGSWLAVTAVDENNVILSSANGCGDAQHFCLSAPGYTEVALQEEYTDQDYSQYTRNTAIASAYVTGAVAVLKEAFPNLTNSAITNIMLISATDLGASGVDAVYGHGMLNIGAALEPIGTLNVQTNSVRLDVDATGTSLALAPSFGGDIGAGFTIGAVDDYNRHYNVAVANSTQQSASFDASDYFTATERNIVSEQSFGTSNRTNLVMEQNAENANSLALTHKHDNGTTSFRFDSDYQVTDFALQGGENKLNLHATKINPEGKDLSAISNHFTLGNAIEWGQYIAKGTFASGNDFSEIANQVTFNTGNASLNLTVGQLQEQGQFLGAVGTGAYALGSATKSNFANISFNHNLGKDNAVSISYAGFDADVDMRYSQFAAIDNLQANEYKLGFTSNNLLRKNDRLRLELNMPLAVTSGTLSQNSINGYDGDANFTSENQSYNLASESRTRQVQAIYELKASDTFHWFSSVSLDKNSNHQNGERDENIKFGVKKNF